MPDTLLSNTASDTVLDDRRRPGRVAVDEALIPMLRNPAGDGKRPSERMACEMVESIFPPRLGRSILISLGLWGAILAGVVVVLR